MIKLDHLPAPRRVAFVSYNYNHQQMYSQWKKSFGQAYLVHLTGLKLFALFLTTVNFSLVILGSFAPSLTKVNKKFSHMITNNNYLLIMV